MSVALDRTLPVFYGVSIVSSNVNSTESKLGDVVTVLFNMSEPLRDGIVCTIGGIASTVTVVSGSNYSCSATMTSAVEVGYVNFSISTALDFAGNAANGGSSQVSTTDGSFVIFGKCRGYLFGRISVYANSRVWLVSDDVLPTITSLHVASNNSNTSMAAFKDVVTVTFSVSELVQSSVLYCKIAGHSVTPTLVADSSGLNYTCFWPMTEGDAEGVVLFEVSHEDDVAGNVGASRSVSTDGSYVIYGKLGLVLRLCVLDADT